MRELIISRRVGPEDRKRAVIAYHNASNLLAQHGLQALLKQSTVAFDRVSPDGKKDVCGRYHPRIDVIIVYTKGAGIEDMEIAILHELGHRIHSKHQGFFQKVSILLKHLMARSSWYVTDYAKTDEHEMFAEMFVSYVHEMLDDDQTKWMDGFLRRLR